MAENIPEPIEETDSTLKHWAHRLTPVGIIVVAVALAFAAGWNNSATADEPYHTLAGFTYIAEGHGDLNPEHPPLTKLLTGLALAPLKLRSTVSPPFIRLDRLGEEVRRFIYENRAPAATLLGVARLPFLLFLIALLAGVYCWGEFMFSRRAALIALVAVASQPLVLGHSLLVHTDVPAAAAWTWTMYFLHRWLAGWRRGWLAVGGWLAIALLIKYSSVYLGVLVVLAVLIVVLKSRYYRLLAGLAGCGLVCIVVLWLGMLPGLRKVTVVEEQTTIAKYLSIWPNTTDLSRRLQSLADFSVPFAHYALGLAYVKETNEHGQGINYFLGKKRSEGFALYFPVALTLKTSLPFLLAALWGFALALWRRSIVPLALVAVIVYYFLISWSTTYNIGARHLMPIIPVLALLIGFACMEISRKGGLILTMLLTATPLVSYPHYIAHFSILVGGARHGAAYLNDSNLDWSQDWRRLAMAAKDKGWYPLSFVYIGAGSPAAELGNATDALATSGLPTNGYIAVSSFTATVGVEYLTALRYREDALHLQALQSHIKLLGQEVGDVGHTIKVYRIDRSNPTQMSQ